MHICAWILSLICCVPLAWSADEQDVGIAKRFLDACFANDQKSFLALWVGQAELIAINEKLGSSKERGVEAKVLARDVSIVNGHKALVRYLQTNAISRDMISGEKALFLSPKDKSGYLFVRDGLIIFSALGKTHTVQVDEAVKVPEGSWQFYWEPKRLEIRTDPKTYESIRLDK